MPHDSQQAAPQPFLFSQWNIPSISLKHNPRQPSFFPQVVVHRLRQELAGAQKRLEEYEDLSTYLGSLCIIQLLTLYSLVASLYVVLNDIHSNVCHTCRERISGANLAPSPAAATPMPFSSSTLGKETNAA